MITDTPCNALAQCLWYHSVSLCLAEGYENEQQNSGPMSLVLGRNSLFYRNLVNYLIYFWFPIPIYQLPSCEYYTMQTHTWRCWWHGITISDGWRFNVGISSQGWVTQQPLLITTFKYQRFTAKYRLKVPLQTNIHSPATYSYYYYLYF